MSYTLRHVIEQLPDEFLDAPCSGVAIIVATVPHPCVIRTMPEDLFIELCQVVTGGRAVEVSRCRS